MTRDTSSEDYTTEEKALKHDQLTPLLGAMFRDFQEAAKKKPDGVLSTRKVAIVNRLLTDLLTLLDGEPTRGYLDLLDEEDVPQNSEVALILGQVDAAMAAFKNRYHGYSSRDHRHIWFVK